MPVAVVVVVVEAVVVTILPWARSMAAVTTFSAVVAVVTAEKVEEEPLSVPVSWSAPWSVLFAHPWVAPVVASAFHRLLPPSWTF